MAIVCANPRTKRNNVNFHPFFDGILNELMNSTTTETTQNKQAKSSYPSANILEECRKAGLDRFREQGGCHQ